MMCIFGYKSFPMIYTIPSRSFSIQKTSVVDGGFRLSKKTRDHKRSKKNITVSPASVCGKVGDYFILCMYDSDFLCTRIKSCSYRVVSFFKESKGII